MYIMPEYETPSCPTEDVISINPAQAIPFKRPPDHKTNVIDVSQLQLQLPRQALFRG